MQAAFSIIGLNLLDEQREEHKKNGNFLAEKIRFFFALALSVSTLSPPPYFSSYLASYHIPLGQANGNEVEKYLLSFFQCLTLSTSSSHLTGAACPSCIIVVDVVA